MLHRGSSCRDELYLVVRWLDKGGEVEVPLYMESRDEERKEGKK